MNTKELFNKFALHDRDSGSVQRQVVALTEEINALTNHTQQNPQDFSSRRGLMKKVNRRKAFLRYIKNDNQNLYNELIASLGLRK
ncbi:30S ribosomal protein S15 [Candidatus Dependentiae bacterium]|nr:30S ribosomal protein S15 [Candidatus Dependentiae bacterium]